MKLLQDKLEIRKAYFLKAFNREPEEMAIVSFAACNLQCPYCKRDMQYINKEGHAIRVLDISFDELLESIEEQVQKGRRIRLSGGDPCMFPNESLKIAKLVLTKYSKKISIAHNATSLSFIQMMLP